MSPAGVDQSLPVSFQCVAAVVAMVTAVCICSSEEFMGSPELGINFGKIDVRQANLLTTEQFDKLANQSVLLLDNVVDNR